MAKRKRGRPKKGEEVLNKEALEVIEQGLAIGGTFREVAELVGVENPAIFSYMNGNPAFMERVHRARANGVVFRKMMLEDSLYAAVCKIADDPRYTTLVIFCAKAQLGMTDITESEAENNKFKEILAEIVYRKRQQTALERDAKNIPYLPSNRMEVVK
jgi:hypothetical protein